MYDKQVLYLHNLDRIDHQTLQPLVQRFILQLLFIQQIWIFCQKKFKINMKLYYKLELLCAHKTTSPNSATSNFYQVCLLDGVKQVRVSYGVAIVSNIA